MTSQPKDQPHDYGNEYRAKDVLSRMNSKDQPVNRGKVCNCGMGCNPMHPPCKDYKPDSSSDQPVDELRDLVKQFVFDYRMNASSGEMDDTTALNGSVDSIMYLFTSRLQAECNRARRDEVERIPNTAIIGMDGRRKEPMFEYRVRRLQQLMKGRE